MKRGGLPRIASIAGILASAAYLAAAIVAAPAGFYGHHMVLALYGSLVLFPHAVAIAYVASASPRNSRPLQLAAVLSPAAIAAPLLGLYALEAADLAVLAAFAPMIAAAARAAATRRGSARLSMILVSATYTVSMATIAYYLWVNATIIEKALMLVAAFDVTLIYAVTVHSLPSTFGDRPVAGASPVPHALAAAAALAAPWSTTLFSILLAASMAVYLVAARIARAYKYYERLSRLDPSTPAYKGMKYFLDGHIWVLATTLVTIAYAVVSALGVIEPREPPNLALLHVVVLGFVMIHILIHEPMMVPVILGLKHKRVFIPHAYPAAVLAAFAWPFNPGFALIIAGLVLASMFAMTV